MGSIKLKKKKKHKKTQLWQTNCHTNFTPNCIIKVLYQPTYERVYQTVSQTEQSLTLCSPSPCAHQTREKKGECNHIIMKYTPKSCALQACTNVVCAFQPPPKKVSSEIIGTTTKLEMKIRHDNYKYNNSNYQYTHGRLTLSFHTLICWLNRNMQDWSILIAFKGTTYRIQFLLFCLWRMDINLQKVFLQVPNLKKKKNLLRDGIYWAPDR